MGCRANLNSIIEWLPNLVFLILVVLAQTAGAQFESTMMSTEYEDADLEAKLGELKLITAYATSYFLLPETEKQVWASKVESPEAGAEVPFDSRLTEWLLGALGSESNMKKAAYWAFGYDAVRSLRMVIPGDERLVQVCKRILEMDLPQEINYIPHETLIEMCLRVLVESGEEENIAYVYGAESSAFWGTRTVGSKQVDPSPIVASEEDALLLTLRGKAPLVLCLFGETGRGLDWIEEIMAREGESAAYVTLMKRYIDYVNTQSGGKAEKPMGHDPVTVLPQLPGDSRTLTPYEALPVLDYKQVSRVKPNLEDLFKHGAISQLVFEISSSLAEPESNTEEVRIGFCRELGKENGLPFELSRWTTMNHVLLAGSLGLKDELELVASKWLGKFRTDWQYLPESWKENRRGERNINVLLRGYLAHLYMYIESEQFDWPIEERLRKAKAIMQPIFEIEDPEEQDVLLARLFYVEVLEVLYNKWERIGKETLETPEARESFALEASLKRQAIETEQLEHLEKVRSILDLIENSPIRTDIARRGVEVPVAAVRKATETKMTEIIELQHQRVEINRIVEVGRIK